MGALTPLTTKSFACLCSRSCHESWISWESCWHIRRRVLPGLEVWPLSDFIIPLHLMSRLRTVLMVMLKVPLTFDWQIGTFFSLFDLPHVLVRRGEGREKGGGD